MPDLEIRRTFHASPAEVWAAITSPRALDDWFWPFPTTASIEPRAGGCFRLTSDVVTMNGTVTAIDPPRQLAMAWQWDGEPDHTQVEMILTPTESGTELRLNHFGFASDAERDQHITGWSDCLDRLPAFLDAPRGH